jgi:hypothetical protein
VIVSSEDRAVFGDELRARRRGRPRVAFSAVRVSVRLPDRVYDEIDRRARQSDASVPEIIRSILAREFRR